MCKSIAEDFVDICENILNYNAKYDTDVPPEIWSKWGQLFIHGLPISDTNDDRDDIINQLEEIIHLQGQREEAISDRDFFDYHEKLNVWRIRVRI